MLICGSGEPPTISKLSSTSCCGTEPLFGPNREPTTMYRCFQVERGISGSVTASCTGATEAERELFAYMDVPALGQCSSQNFTTDFSPLVDNFIWMSVICGEEVVWGGRRKYLQAIGFSDAADDDMASMDSCVSSYDCGGGEFCVGQELLVSASAGMESSCLSDADEYTPNGSFSSSTSDTTEAAEVTNGSGCIKSAFTSSTLFVGFQSIIFFLNSFWGLG